MTPIRSPHGPRIIVIAGTDRGVGKTWLTCALGRALVAGGVSVVAIKAVEGGCDAHPADDEDGVRLACATGQAMPRRALRRYAAPLPVVTASETGSATDLVRLTAEIVKLGWGTDVVLVEGAGGLLEPLAGDWNATDIARALAARVVLVASDSIGTLNHTLLALGAVHRAGLELAGVALAPPHQRDRSTGLNAATLRRLAGVDRVVTLGRIDDPFSAGGELRPIVDWVLCGR